MKLKNIVLLGLIWTSKQFAAQADNFVFEYTIKNNTQQTVQVVQNSRFCNMDVCVIAPGGSTTIKRPCKINDIIFGIGQSLFEKNNTITKASACYAKDPTQKLAVCDVSSRCWQSTSVEIEPSTWVIDQYVGDYVEPGKSNDETNGVLQRNVLQPEKNVGYIITQLKGL